MTELTDILDRFNRKERNLLIRDALGHSQSKALFFNDDFRDRISAALGGLKVPPDSWWATDYHLNWIAGALALLRQGNEAIGTAQFNKSSEDQTYQLVKQNQEDVDLLIAFDRTLILIEVKAFGYFTNKQIDSKLQRWRLLKQESELAEVTLYFMLMSRAKPAGLSKPPNDLLHDVKEWPHAVLSINSPFPKLKVTGRKPGNGKSVVDPNTWFIAPISHGIEDDDDGFIKSV